jgi:hypothetical protein
VDAIEALLLKPSFVSSLTLFLLAGTLHVTLIVFRRPRLWPVFV